MAEAGSKLAAKVLALGAFIPSALESHQMMYAKQLGYLADLKEDRWYWTSTQSAAYRAYTMYFSDGYQYSHDKSTRLASAPSARFSSFTDSFLH
ncbi:hypothetical protein D3C80_1763690 [compost metagenome]